MQMQLLKNRIEKGERAEKAKEYIFKLLEKYKSEIMQNLEKGEHIRKLHGMAHIIKKIEQDILKDIAHKDDAVVMMKKGEINGTKY